MPIDPSKLNPQDFIRFRGKPVRLAIDDFIRTLDGSDPSNRTAFPRIPVDRVAYYKTNLGFNFGNMTGVPEEKRGFLSWKNWQILYYAEQAGILNKLISAITFNGQANYFIARPHYLEAAARMIALGLTGPDIHEILDTNKRRSYLGLRLLNTLANLRAAGMSQEHVLNLKTLFVSQQPDAEVCKFLENRFSEWDEPGKDIVKGKISSLEYDFQNKAYLNKMNLLCQYVNLGTSDMQQVNAVWSLIDSGHAKELPLLFADNRTPTDINRLGALISQPIWSNNPDLQDYCIAHCTMPAEVLLKVVDIYEHTSPDILKIATRDDETVERLDKFEEGLIIGIPTGILSGWDTQSFEVLSATMDAFEQAFDRTAANRKLTEQENNFATAMQMYKTSEAHLSAQSQERLLKIAQSVKTQDDLDNLGSLLHSEIEAAVQAALEPLKEQMAENIMTCFKDWKAQGFDAAAFSEKGFSYLQIAAIARGYLAELDRKQHIVDFSKFTPDWTVEELTAAINMAAKYDGIKGSSKKAGDGKGYITITEVNAYGKATNNPEKTFKFYDKLSFYRTAWQHIKNNENKEFWSYCFSKVSVDNCKQVTVTPWTNFTENNKTLQMLADIDEGFKTEQALMSKTANTNKSIWTKDQVKAFADKHNLSKSEAKAYLAEQGVLVEGTGRTVYRTFWSLIRANFDNGAWGLKELASELEKRLGMELCERDSYKKLSKWLIGEVCPDDTITYALCDIFGINHITGVVMMVKAFDDYHSSKEEREAMKDSKITLESTIEDAKEKGYTGFGEFDPDRNKDT